VVAVTAPAREPLALRLRLSHAAQTAAYVVLALPLGVVGMLALAAMLVGLSGPSRRIVGLERRLGNSLLAARIPSLGIAGAPARNVVALLLLRPAVAVAAALAAAAPIVLTAALLAYGIEGLAGPGDRYVGPWPLDAAAGSFLVLLAAPAAVISVAVLEALRLPLRALVRRLLVTTSSRNGGAVREALAETIGDDTLAIAYWLPERAVFVDERGLPIELPTPESGRAWTAVEHEGTRVAAIIHDAELDARPELVRAAAAGAVLALDNERLKADLRARVAELRASRTRIVEAGLEARRRLERDLHDGAQQHLVALSLDLQLIRSRVAHDPDALSVIHGSIDKLANALSELRELARGIHPAILTDRGLAPALLALVERTPLAVESNVAIEERVAPACEAAAYFVVAEGLTNVVKYARAERVAVRVRRDGDDVVVEIEDDGVGGADPAGGSGLRGLEDRVSALDGQLHVDSAPGEGTRIVARIPASPPT
jgi:signal transduction histidine kinase